MARLITQFIPTGDTASISFKNNLQDEVRIKAYPGTEINLAGANVIIGDEETFNYKDENGIQNLTILNWDTIKNIAGYYFVANFYKNIIIEPQVEESTSTDSSEITNLNSETETENNSESDSSEIIWLDNHDGPNVEDEESTSSNINNSATIQSTNPKLIITLLENK